MTTVSKKRYSEALRDAMSEELARDSDVVVLGEDVGAYGGVFKATDGLQRTFGENRVLDTPISENGIVGAAVGMAMHGLRPVVEIMYSDFITLALDSLVNGAALYPFVYAGQVKMPIVVRTQGGGGGFAGAQHSKSLEVLTAAIPGLRTVMPHSPADAKGMLKAAIRSDDPVVFYEHKLLYNRRDLVPDDPDYVVPLDRAKVVRPGSAATVFAISRTVLTAVAAAEVLASEGIDVEVVDLRSLRPLDVECIAASVASTHRALVVTEAWLHYGPSAEVAATIFESSFGDLHAPVRRLGGLDMPIPASPALEPLMVPTAEAIAGAVRRLIKEGE